MIKNKKIIQQVLGLLVAANAIVFLLLAYFQAFSSTPRAIVFIDFWGRLCVYSLWFTGYALYRKYLPNKSILKSIIVTIVILNIPVFLTLGYFNKLSPDLDTLPFIDFWGRLTVYSLWFMAYEFYRNFIKADVPQTI
ncbi:MAG: hypothetical protein A2275_00490 [Bacteroidetes bacterium RIFOXYA12_FULL_35_11]|nr:MAG: hypothetical protein A2X01_18545 [Bacteroidetes bacterium GWF2_35_48]OFY75304.1 MAG: hypothetical protein A2275_00490 [Bacteroidetes bacterium RIFOXYA12_FULL_35_11]OFY95852.1 MAG: hypothetical protein A2309_10500 [Bacteroidetes bacterium RIFOXYB2_FULL_35_7]OFY98428.1 MAG: hypothetical protein A2491_09790 [Bacteroidetes bacterium RIFOXYC12_FULL_35_7]